MRKVEDEFGKDEWWFKVWGPEAGRRRHRPRRGLGHEGRSAKTANWHGFGKLADGFNMLTRSSRPSTPGLDLQGKFSDTGIPASVVTKFLVTGVIVEKTGLYSFIMFTIGITKGRWNTLLTALQQFGRLRAQPADVAIRRSSASSIRVRAARPARPVPPHPQAVCAYDCAADHRDVPERPHAGDEAERRLAHRAPQDRARRDRPAAGQHDQPDHAVPPGIPLLIPGEVFNKKIVDYLKFAREFNTECPGFETDIHGLVGRIDETGRKRYYADCVRAA
jgi:arginine/lysine/ornithine decarboxylase